jgi:tRNA (guanine37-N1)-methyltransferase
VRIDVVSIFPAYLDALDLSLVGKARRDGLLHLAVHDLRNWTADRHRTVDDTPFGGGAGMVMRPDVWGLALDDVLARGRAAASGDDGALDDGAAIGGAPDGWEAVHAVGRTVLLVPTPSGEVFTQRTAEDLAGADHLVVACGRYEGIDARVTDHYRARTDVEVREISIGDYVLNGGEVAALVVIEAVARLLPGVIGNPLSLVEESHGAAGLLEYPVYTKPPEWEDLAVPDVLLSGHHGKVARWRRDEALRRTAARRPDLLTALAPADLDRHDRRVLAGLGWFATPDALRRVRVRRAGEGDAAVLAEVAARTFPLACPPTLDDASIAAFVTTSLSPERFAAYLADPARELLLAEEELGGGASRAVGYTMLVHGSSLPGEAGAAEAVGAVEPGEAARAAEAAEAAEAAGAGEAAEAGAPEPAAAASSDLPSTAELSKCYIDAPYQGTGMADLLIATALEAARASGHARVWLGTNRVNGRARRFYARHGFAVVGARQFRVGDVLEDDVVMALDFTSTAHAVAE